MSPRRNGSYLFAGEYFTEEVRREIIARYGEDALYEGGLSVRTTLDPRVTTEAREATEVVVAAATNPLVTRRRVINWCMVLDMPGFLS